VDIYLHVLFVSYCHILINETATVGQHQATEVSMSCEGKKRKIFLWCSQEEKSDAKKDEEKKEEEKPAGESS